MCLFVHAVGRVVSVVWLPLGKSISIESREHNAAVLPSLRWTLFKGSKTICLDLLKFFVLNYTSKNPRDVD